MAGLLDVQNCLVSIANAAVYPKGTANASITGAEISVFAGWPNSESLNAAMAKGIVFITVFPKAMERNVTRYSTDQEVVKQAVPTLTATVSGQTVTIGGTPSSPQNVALLIGGQAYVYPVQITDTLTSIATSLAGIIAPFIPGTSNSGPVLTIGGSATISARIGASGSVAAEYKRQERVLCLTIWASTPAQREVVANAIDVALAQLKFLSLPDGYAARLIYKNSPDDDGLQKQTIYRRDLNYSVEYATTVTTSAPAVIVEDINIKGGVDPTAPFIKTINI